MAAPQVANDLAVLVVEVSKRRIIEGRHSLSLIENDANRAVLKQQPRLALQKDAHILVQPQLNKVLRQLLI